MTTASSQEPLREALEQLRSALELLDAAEAPLQVGACVDLAIQQLYSALAHRIGGDLAHLELNAELH